MSDGRLAEWLGAKLKPYGFTKTLKQAPNPSLLSLGLGVFIFIGALIGGLIIVLDKEPRWPLIIILICMPMGSLIAMPFLRGWLQVNKNAKKPLRVYEIKGAYPEK